MKLIAYLKHFVSFLLHGETKPIFANISYLLPNKTLKGKKIIVTTIDALMLPMTPKKANNDTTILIKKDEEINFTKLAQKLVELRIRKS